MKSVPIQRAAMCTVLGMLYAAAIRSAAADDLSTVSNRVISALINNDPSKSTVEGYMSSLNSNGSWSDINYNSTANVSWTPLTHLDRLTSMAEAYEDSSSSLYQSASLKSDILSAYNYWVAQDPQSVNWFYNDIDTPQELSNVMVLVNGILSSSQRSSGLNIVARADASRSDNSGENIGDNRVLRATAAINQGIIAGSNSITANAFAAIGDAMVVTSGDGIQKDGAFHQHGAQLYNSGYGSDFAGDVVNAMGLGANTGFAFSNAQNQTMVDYLLNGTQWMVRGQVIDYTASGRDITRKGQDNTAQPLEGELKSLIADNLGYRTSELQAFESRIASSNKTGSENPALSLTGNREFYSSDFMVTQRPSYYASVTLSSVNTIQPETGNGEGLKNLYLADGVNLIMQTGNEYNNIFPVWNWRMLPGTTVEQDGRSLTPGAEFGVAGTSTFAGGASDGTYGTSAFAYNRYNVEAKKSWFFFDNEYAALGAGINAANSTSDVDTTINQTLLSGKSVSYGITGSSSVQTLSLGNTVTPHGLQWVINGGFGYYFPTAVNNATIEALTQSGAWSSINTRYDNTEESANVFTLFLDHGKGFTGGSYDYIVVPNATVSEMERYGASNPIQVLSNTASIQALRETSIDVTQASFFSRGTVNLDSTQSFSVSDPSSVMMQRPANTFSLTAASPANAAIPLSISLNHVNFSGGGNSWLDGFTKNATVILGLPGGDQAGSSVGASITTDGAANPTIQFASVSSPTSFSYSSSANLALPGDTTLNSGAGHLLEFDGVISGSASLIKTGDSSLTLTGNNTYTGGTRIDEGAITVSNDQRAANGGWNIGPNSNNATTVAFDTTSKLSISSGNAFNVGNNSPNGEVQQSAYAQGTVNNAGSLTVGRDGYLRVTGTWTQSGPVAVNAWGSSTYSPTLAVSEGGNFTYTGNTPITLNPAPTSDGSPTLYIGNSDGAGTLTTGQGFVQTTISTGGGSSNVTLRGGGTLVLSNNIAQLTTGPIAFTVGDSGGIINTNGYNAGLSAPLDSTSDSTGGFMKQGNGTLELFSPGNLAGNTEIANGTLKVSNGSGSATGSGDVLIDGGAALAGSGIIKGTVTISNGAIISPGDGGAGMLTTGAQTWAGGGQYNFNVAVLDNTSVQQSALQGLPGGADFLDINGGLTINSTITNPFIVAPHGNFAGWDETHNYSWAIGSASAGITGFSASRLGLDASNFAQAGASPGAWTFTVSGGKLVLNYSTDTVSATGNTTFDALPGAPSILTVAPANSGTANLPAQSIGEIALKLSGATNLAQFIAHLQVATGSDAIAIESIGANAPAWLSGVGGASQWDVLVQFNQPLNRSQFDWDFQQDPGVSLNQIAIDPTPEPASLALLAAGAIPLLHRRRRIVG